MGTSSKRFLIMMILMDILIVAMFSAFGGGAYDGNDITTTRIESIDGFTSTTKTNYEDNTVDTLGTRLENSYGNTVSLMGGMWKLMTSGITLPSETMECNDCPDETTGTAFSIFLWFFFAIIHILGLFEAFQLIYSKKTD